MKITFKIHIFEIIKKKNNIDVISDNLIIKHLLLYKKFH